MTENELMLTSILDCRRIDLSVDSKVLTPEQRSRYDRMQIRRTCGEPLQYIIGECDFMGIPLSVDARALIPRPETEILTELAIQRIKAINEASLQKEGCPIKILDIGVGSGNISIALTKNIGNVTVTALDVSEDALSLAAGNAKAHGVDRRITFLCKDMAAYLKKAADCGEKFDMIISNPPYIPTGQLAELPADVRQEPRLALDGGDDGLRFYRTIVQWGPRVLNPASHLLMEIGDGQRSGIEAIFRRHLQYQPINFCKDYVGADRIVAAQLRNGRLN